jgi:hypothetical protein
MAPPRPLGRGAAGLAGPWGRRRRRGAQLRPWKTSASSTRPRARREMGLVARGGKRASAAGSPTAARPGVGSRAGANCSCPLTKRSVAGPVTPRFCLERCGQSRFDQGLNMCPQTMGAAGRAHARTRSIRNGVPARRWSANGGGLVRIGYGDARLGEPTSWWPRLPKPRTHVNTTPSSTFTRDPPPNLSDRAACPLSIATQRSVERNDNTAARHAGGRALAPARRLPTAPARPRPRRSGRLRRPPPRVCARGRRARADRAAAAAAAVAARGAVCADARARRRRARRRRRGARGVGAFRRRGLSRPPAGHHVGGPVRGAPQARRRRALGRASLPPRLCAFARRPRRAAGRGGAGSAGGGAAAQGRAFAASRAAACALSPTPAAPGRGHGRGVAGRRPESCALCVRVAG